MFNENAKSFKRAEHISKLTNSISNENPCSQLSQSSHGNATIRELKPSKFLFLKVRGTELTIASSYNIERR